MLVSHESLYLLVISDRKGNGYHARQHMLMLESERRSLPVDPPTRAFPSVFGFLKCPLEFNEVRVRVQ